MNKKYLNVGLGIAVVLIITGIFMFSNGIDDHGEQKFGDSALSKNPGKTTVYLFWGDGCPHCAKEKSFLEKLEKKYEDDLEVKMYEVYNNKENQKLFQEVAKAYGIEARGVPIAFIGDEHWTGYADRMNEEIENQVKQCIENGCEGPLA